MWSRRINYVILIILVAAGLLFYHNYTMMIFLAVLFALPIISYILTRISTKRIDVYIEAEKTSVGKNIPVEVYFYVKYKGYVPSENVLLSIFVENGFYENKRTYEICVPVMPFKDRNVSMKVEGNYCGNITVKVDKLVLSDPLGMFEFSKKVDGETNFVIMPEKLFDIENIQLSTKDKSEDDEMQFRKGDDVSQISEIRSYIPGDRLQNIHWKLSAKKEDLQVKEFSLPYSNELSIILELKSDNETVDILDDIIEDYYGFGYYLLKNQRKFNVVWYDDVAKDLKIIRVETEDDFILSFDEIFFVNRYKKNLALELYSKVYQETFGTTIYIGETGSLAEIQYEKFDIDSGKAVVACIF